MSLRSLVGNGIIGSSHSAAAAAVGSNHAAAAAAAIAAAQPHLLPNVKLETLRETSTHIRGNGNQNKDIGMTIICRQNLPLCFRLFDSGEMSFVFIRVKIIFAL